MATKPELRRAVANSYIKAGDYNYNFEQLNNYIENGIADNAISIYENDREYSKGQWVLANTSDGNGLYESQVDGNKGNSLLDTTYWKKVNLGSGLELCDIGMALYVDETKGLRRYLNGQIVDINTNTQAFLNRLLEIKNTNPDYFTTEDNWQSEATLNIDGCVYKFVLNYSGETVVSVRLPKYPDYVEINAGGTLPVVGNGMTLGWTDGTVNLGSATGSTGNYHFQFLQGSYGAGVGSAPGTGAPSGAKNVGITSDPTKSGIKTTLKQTKLKMHYFIQIATGSETENNIINEIELNNPFSLFDSKYSDHELNNLSWLKSEGQWNAKAVYTEAYDKLLKVYNGTETVEGLSVKLSTETYTDYDFVLNTANETFRLPLLNGSENLPSQKFDNLTLTSSDSIYIAPANGRYYLKMSANTGQFINMHRINASGDDIIISHDVSVNNLDVFTEIEVRKGDKVRITHNTSGNVLAFKFIYAQGNGSLYFYVGETVQNANLIDAGRIGEQLATKTDMLQASGAGMPSYRYVELTLGASDATYTAPANGYVQIVRQLTSNAYTWQILCVLKDGQTTVSDANMEYREGDSSTSNSAILEQLVPVKSGRTFSISYGGGSANLIFFRFIYAEGSK